MYPFSLFRKLPPDLQVEELNAHGEPLDLACAERGTETVLFAYNDFYVELVVRPVSDEILALRSFRSLRRLAPYLHQVNIDEIRALLSLDA